MSQLLTPKFLTQEVGLAALSMAYHVVFDMGDIFKFKRKQCYAVLLVPGMKDGRPDYPDWPNYPLEPTLLAEGSVGDPAKFEYDFAGIAKCKALQLWHGRNDGGTDVQPHLLFPGDTPYWGGAKSHGLVAACSGLQPHYDRLISELIISMAVALARDAFLASEEVRDKASFLT